MTDTSKQLTWEISSLPFGETTSIAGQATNNLRFPGQYADAETGNHYNYFRDYNPNVGRYVESDPIGIERGSNHLYGYAQNGPIKNGDILGLTIWLCNRQVVIFPYIGNHAYFWDDRNNRCCGRNNGHNPLKSCKEKGWKGGDSCMPLPDSSGKEDKIMTCCEKTANNLPWIPYVNDCHDSVNRCLKASGVENPGAPGGRLGPCDSCYTKKAP